MGRIEERWGKVLDYGLYIVLIICYLLIIPSLLHGPPITGETLALIGIFLFIPTAWAKHRKKYSLMILAFLAFVSGIYLYSYSLQYPTSFEYIYTDFHLQESDIVEFYDFESRLIFDEKETVLIMRVTFDIETINKTNSIMWFSLPPSTKYYRINVSGKVHRREGGTWKYFPVTLFFNETGSIKDNTFPELNRLNVQLEGGRYEAEMIYKLPKMDPYLKFRTRISGSGSPQNIKYIRSIVYFNDMFYECIDPCLVL